MLRSLSQKALPTGIPSKYRSLAPRHPPHTQAPKQMNDFSSHYQRLRFLSIFALLGLLILLVSAVISQMYSSPSICDALMILGGILVLPGFIYTYCLTILHWKHLYTGRHSNLWGILLLIETSGICKIIYFIRHILPDLSRSRRSCP